jgi:outer membrane protein assembly factor BamE (lipoprotein component of BamABCDE complex)
MKQRSLIQRPANWRACFLMAIGSAMALSACLVIPVDYYSKGSRHNISAKTQSLLQPGVTTKEDVFLLLGEPDYTSDDDRCIGYRWRKAKSVYLFVFVNVADIGEHTKSYLLQIKFDRDNRVVAVDLREAWGPVVPRPE